jgi:hypothetical protein
MMKIPELKLAQRWNLKKEDGARWASCLIFSR